LTDHINQRYKSVLGAEAPPPRCSKPEERKRAMRRSLRCGIAAAHLAVVAAVADEEEEA
jgi:hypothetical protein